MDREMSLGSRGVLGLLKCLWAFQLLLGGKGERWLDNYWSSQFILLDICCCRRGKYVDKVEVRVPSVVSQGCPSGTVVNGPSR